MKDHHSYDKKYVGGSDIAALTCLSISNDGLIPELVRFGSDGEYMAYVVDAECSIPASYELTISHDGRGWMKLYDDDAKEFEARFENGFRIFRRGERGIIIQVL